MNPFRRDFVAKLPAPALPIHTNLSNSYEKYWTANFSFGNDKPTYSSANNCGDNIFATTLVETPAKQLTNSAVLLHSIIILKFGNTLVSINDCVCPFILYCNFSRTLK